MSKLTPLHAPKELYRVPEAVYDQLVRAAIRTGEGEVSQHKAEEIVDAILGPLRLVGPIPVDRLQPDACSALYFSVDGVWSECRKDPEHGLEDHLDYETEEFWDSGDFRFVPRS